MPFPELIFPDLSDYFEDHIRAYLRSAILFMIRPDDQQLLDSLLDKDEIDEAVAYAFVLTDLANSDGNFDPRERQIIQRALAEIFPHRSKESPFLIKTAENLLACFRTETSFIASIKQIYSVDEREKLYAIIEHVILSDGTITPDEEYFRHKYRTALI